MIPVNNTGLAYPLAFFFFSDSHVYLSDLDEMLATQCME